MSVACVACLLLATSPAVLWAASKNGSSSGATTPAPIVPNPVAVLVNKYDTDHDGKLDKFELKKLQDENPTAYGQAMAFDADKDGTLDVAEIAAWINSGTPKVAPGKAAGAKKNKGA